MVAAYYVSALIMVTGVGQSSFPFLAFDSGQLLKHIPRLGDGIYAGKGEKSNPACLRLA